MYNVHYKELGEIEMIQKIKSKLLEARKAKNTPAVEILKVLLGEIESEQKRGNEVNDAFIIARAKKLIESNKDCIEHTFSNDAIRLSMQNDVLETLIPQQLNEESITKIINDNSFKNMGEFMAHMKSNYAGMYDGKLASSIAKKAIV